MTVVEPARASPRPIRPLTQTNTLLAGAVGFVLVLGLIFLLESMDDTLRTTDELTQASGVSALGAVNHISGRQDQSKLLFLHDTLSPATEAYRKIRSNIQFKTADQPVKSIVVASANAGEGKSITTANLGIAMARAGLKTIIVDANLRQPVQHHLFQVSNQWGLADLLRSPELNLPELLKNTRVANLQVLTSGAPTSNPAEVLGSKRTRQVLDKLCDLADIVICDSPSVLGFTDAAILSNLADGVVLVIEAGQTPRDAVRKAISNLDRADANLLGAVLNRAPEESYQPRHTGPLIPSLEINWRLVARVLMLAAVGVLAMLIYLQYLTPFATKLTQLTPTVTKALGLAVVDTPARPESQATESGAGTDNLQAAPAKEISPSLPSSPTSTPSATASGIPSDTLSTPGIVARFGNLVPTGNWAVTILGAKRAAGLPAEDRELKPSGQWLIVYGQVENPTIEKVAIHTQDFALITSSLGDIVDVHADATAAASLLFGVDKAVSGPSGMDIQPGQTEPLILAFDTPKSVKEARLNIVEAGVQVDLSSVAEMEILQFREANAQE